MRRGMPEQKREGTQKETVDSPSLVIVPRDELHEVVSERDARLLIEDARAGIAYEVARHDVVVLESEYARHVALRRLLDLRAYGLVARALVEDGRQVHDRDVRRGNAEAHARELAVELRYDLPHRLGGARRARDDVVARRASAPPVLLGGAVDGLEFVVHDLRERREAVGGAARVGHHVHGRVVLGVVDPDDEHGSVGRGRRDDDLLRAPLHVHAGLLDRGEDSGRFDDVIGTRGSPRDFGRVHLSEYLDDLAVDGEGLGLLVVGYGLPCPSVDGVVFVHVLHWCRRALVCAFYFACEGVLFG